ncbi:isoprenoid synthase domain-containing protein [Artemisia annua]|uniref:Isoprenoid synthase domain-containing protein n=1 Tax=Artemisia annua TaxID=35608 RepID=A0A2U1LS55_ARTAN|nr:isoprenoid synthase domain-containing protein [Artemisia annua]
MDGCAEGRVIPGVQDQLQREGQRAGGETNNLSPSLKLGAVVENYTPSKQVEHSQGSSHGMLPLEHWNGITKVAALVTTIDDIYDEYGSLDELKLFTKAIKRDKSTTIYEMGYNALISQGENIMPILQNVWGDLCEVFLVEKKWTHNKYMPTLEEYLENAWISVSGVVFLTHGYLFTNQEIKKDERVSLAECHHLLKWSSMTFRLCNDLATSLDETERGKTVNAITCYMHDTGLCEEVACGYIKVLIDEAW